MLQSRHSEVNVYFLALCEQTGWLSTHRPPRSCGEGELVGGVHTLVGGVVQVYHRLQVVEEEEKERKVEHEVEWENQGEENARMTMHMEMV